LLDDVIFKAVLDNNLSLTLGLTKNFRDIFTLGFAIKSELKEKTHKFKYGLSVNLNDNI
jgi:hypothetical protein